MASVVAINVFGDGEDAIARRDSGRDQRKAQGVRSAAYADAMFDIAELREGFLKLLNRLATNKSRSVQRGAKHGDELLLHLHVRRD